MRTAIVFLMVLAFVDSALAQEPVPPKPKVDCNAMMMQVNANEAAAHKANLVAIEAGCMRFTFYAHGKKRRAPIKQQATKKGYEVLDFNGSMSFDTLVPACRAVLADAFKYSDFQDKYDKLCTADD